MSEPTRRILEAVTSDFPGVPSLETALARGDIDLVVEILAARGLELIPDELGVVLAQPRSAAPARPAATGNPPEAAGAPQRRASR